LNVLLALNLVSGTPIAFVEDSVAKSQQETPLRVSFFGDSGIGKPSRSVLELTKDSNLVVHLGDFDYEDNPSAFEKNIQGVLGPNFPYIAAVGNHDVLKWGGSNGYQARLKSQLSRSIYKDNCTGEFGVNMACRIGDVHIVLSGVGTLGSGHADYIDSQFKTSDAKWKVCGWHKNQRAFQVGGKSDEVGWAVFETCKKHGAIILMGHEHSYGRSKVMKNFQNKEVFSNDLSTVRVGKDHTFSIVSGLGGIQIRDYESNLEKNPWWAKTGASNDGINYGTIICDFYSSEAKCVYKQIDGKEWDRFTVLRDE
jgi:hypothetical protein